MQQVIYADVLVIINMFVTYGIVRLTGIICHSEKKPVLLLIAALLSGIYSLIIISDIPDYIIILSRFPVGALFVFMSFRVYNFRHFIRLYSCFFVVNFLFAGLMFALWYLFSPKGMYFNNGIVYFNINIEMLAVLICVCYFSTLVLNRLTSFKAPVNTLYEVEIAYKGKTTFCKAFYDTGNSLKEPFTGYPVIVLNKDIASTLFDCEISLDAVKNGVPIFRPLFCSTVSGNEMLLCFRADRVRVKGVNCNFVTDMVYIALTNKKIKNGDYSALLSSEIFENKTNGKGDYYLATVIEENITETELSDF